MRGRELRVQHPVDIVVFVGHFPQQTGAHQFFRRREAVLVQSETSAQLTIDSVPNLRTQRGTSFCAAPGSRWPSDLLAYAPVCAPAGTGTLRDKRVSKASLWHPMSLSEVLADLPFSALVVEARAGATDSPVKVSVLAVVARAGLQASLVIGAGPALRVSLS